MEYICTNEDTVVTNTSIVVDRVSKVKPQYTFNKPEEIQGSKSK